MFCFYNLKRRKTSKKQTKKPQNNRITEYLSTKIAVTCQIGKCCLPANAMVAPAMPTAHVGTLLSDVDVV